MMTTSPFAHNWTSPVRVQTVSEARANLKEALELFFETASAAELQDRLRNEFT